MGTRITIPKPPIMSQQVLNKIAPNSPDMKAALRPLQFVSAREIETGHGKKAIVIFVPVPLLQGWHRSQQRLTRELEKKFSDRHVLIIASRRAPSAATAAAPPRPRSARAPGL